MKNYDFRTIVAEGVQPDPLPGWDFVGLGKSWETPNGSRRYAYFRRSENPDPITDTPPPVKATRKKEK